MAVNLYLEGCGFRRIARILSDMFEKHFCYQTVILWIKKAAKKIGNAREKSKKEIQILEMDELYTYIKRSNKIRIWTAVDRNMLKFVDFVVGGGSKEICKSLFDKLKKYTINTM